MQMSTTPPVRRALLAASAAGVAAALMLAGCNLSGNKSESSSQPSVQAKDVTHIPETAQKEAMYFPTGDRLTSVLSIEQVTPHEVRAGVEYTYQVKVTNLTDHPLEGVMVRGSRPEGLRINSIAGSPASQPTGNGWIGYTVGSLAARESRTFDVTGTPSGQGSIRQKYEADYHQEMSTEVKVTAPVVAVSKTGPEQVDICQPIDWTYTVKNTGTGVARHVGVTDTLPEGLTTTDGQAVVAADLGDIPSGQSRQAVAHLKAAHPGKFASAAIVKSDAGDAKSDVVTTVAKQPVLDVAIKGPDKEYLGKPVVYQVTITNSGDTAAQKTTLKVSGAAGARVTAVTDSAGVPLPTDAQGESLGTIEMGKSQTVSVTLQHLQGGMLNLNATASAQCAQQVVKSIDTRIETIAALLLEAVDVKDPVKVGENVVYKITVTNQGNGPDTNINVTATLPDGEQYVDAGGATPATAAGQGIKFGAVPTLDPKQAVTWQVTAKAVKAGDVQFKVTATSDSVKVPAEKTEPTKLY